ncbi:XRE family transcriptional regulator [Paraburkholderia sp. 40]|uniref:XRE family transcriptional regulator n=1 Tax=Paraburkholderia sp. 40 TaxID=2991059 RepID=UPI003D2531FC
MRYAPPSTQSLAMLKETLGYKGSQMADLFGVSSDKQWRKYTGGTRPREVSAHMLFFAMARLILKQKDIEAVLEKMREGGAEIDLNASPASPEQDGEPQP